jgi:hypothetical protein
MFGDVIRSILGSPEFTTALLTALGIVITALVGWVGTMVRRYIVHALSDRDLALLRQIAAIAVQYADQTFKDADGPAKLTEAMKVADAMIASYGLTVTSEQLRAIVEAAVYLELAHTDVLTEPAPVA